ncbi:hypothetical protein ACWCQ1_40190 [Streptomyces sp. NPDC002144]
MSWQVFPPLIQTSLPTGRCVSAQAIVSLHSALFLSRLGLE